MDLLDWFFKDIQDGRDPGVLNCQDDDGNWLILSLVDNGPLAAPQDLLWIDLSYTDACNLDGAVWCIHPQDRNDLKLNTGVAREQLRHFHARVVDLSQVV